MNELDLTNIQAVIFIVVAIGLLLYLNHLDHQKSAQIERGSAQTTETPGSELNPYYGRYIQLAGINKQGDIK